MTETDNQRFDRLDKLRKKAKVVNYSSLYGVGATKLSRESGMEHSEAKKLIEKFWELNWSIKKVAESSLVKEVNGHLWLFNPVSGFWYNLRYDRDRWSTTNQGTGVYLFDSWLARCSNLGYMGNAQFHDETLGVTKIGERDSTTEILQKGISQLNTDLKLNVSMAIDVQYGDSYAEVH